MIQKNIVIIIFILNCLFGLQKILIPMDEIQTNHLKAYGIAF